MNELLKNIKTNTGQGLYELTFKSPVLLLFLRKFGCVFCQESIKDIKRKSLDIEKKGVQICFVHMATTQEGEEYFEKYGLKGVLHISDPDCKIYADFGLVKGRFNQIFGLQVWLRTIESVVVEKSNIFVKQIGDGFQMPGVFYLKDGVIQDQFIHTQASDRPDYMNLIQGCCSADS